jgi:hypothetical protein
MPADDHFQARISAQYYNLDKGFGQTVVCAVCGEDMPQAHGSMCVFCQQKEQQELERLLNAPDEARP